MKTYTDDRLIEKTFIGIWIVNGSSILFGIACVMIDAILTGQFLGSNAVAAAGIVQPVTMLINLVGELFGPGIAVICTRYMGMAKKDMVNRVFSLVITVLFCLLVLLSVLIFFASPIIARALGAKAESEEIVQMVNDYLRGFSFAVIPMCTTITLSGLMMLDNDRGKALAAMLTTLVCDFVFDYMNVKVFMGGMWGMAIATALSNLAGLLVVLTHFSKKDRVLHYSLKFFEPKYLKEVILCGIPNAVSLGSNALRGICFNTFILIVSGEVAVAALSAANSLFSIVNAIGLGIFTTTSSLVSLLYGEGDGNSITKTFRLSKKLVLCVFGGLALVLMLTANIVARAFLDASATEQLHQAGIFIRLMALQYFFFAISYSLSGTYQSIARNGLSYLLVFLREGVFPIFCALSLGAVMGLKGFEIGLPIAGVLMFASCYLIPAVVNKKLSFRSEDMVLLPEGFNPAEGELFEASVHDVEQVAEVSERAREFCLNRNMKKRDALMTALFIEENILNILTHGSGKGPEINVDVRVINRNGNLVIRFRDNGKPFDPVEWYEKNHPDDPAKGLGIRIIVGLAKDVKYVPAMGLNNLMLTL